MTTTYYQRMGDGRRVEMTKDEIISDIEDGSNLAAERARIPGLSDDEKDQLLDIFLTPERIVSVKPGDQVVFSTDVGPTGLFGNYGEFGGVGSAIISPSFSHSHMKQIPYKHQRLQQVQSRTWK